MIWPDFWEAMSAPQGRLYIPDGLTTGHWWDRRASYIKPKNLFSFGISGAIQHTAGLGEADFIIAINKNPQATMMKMADVAIVADASDVLNTLIKELKKRIRE
jgi:hypothetical protein